MKTLEERELRERERNEIIHNAVSAADQVIMNGSDGSVEELDWLTVEVAERFVGKVHVSLAIKMHRKDMED